MFRRRRCFSSPKWGRAMDTKVFLSSDAWLGAQNHEINSNLVNNGLM
jgi:hypothetical protein